MGQRKRSARKKTASFVKQDDSTLLEAQAGLKKARDNLNRAHDDLVSANKMNLSTDLRSVKEDVATLLSDLEQTPGLHPENLDKGKSKAVKNHGRSMRNLANNILAESEKLLKAVKSDEDRKAQSVLESLKQEIKNTANQLHNRPVGKA